MTRVKIKEDGPKYRKNDRVDVRVRKMLDDKRFKHFFKGQDLERNAVEIAKKREHRKKK